ncbi:hypothetical protein TrLO_g1834 [Triparma laevis f. longispina]|uniref:Serine aminopeptidase S33 domain-containing protein n=1 Tax=Triparma laevis f. longispina TaxID=1714387 RepID=A0A9W7E7I0_9STRA|nr:hypothetical protein TrLO_g1834 [Triparma laevis f. longispina]
MPPKKDGKQAPGKQLSRQDSQKRPSDMKRFSIHDTSGAAFDEQGDTKWGFDSEPPKWVLKGIDLDNGGCLMKPQEFFESNATQLKVHHRTYIRKDSAKTRHVFMFPGAGEHCNKFSYQVLAEMITDSGAICHGIDMQAHGHSEEFETQFIADHQDLVSDACQWLQAVMKGKDGHTFQFQSHAAGSAIAIIISAMFEDPNSPVAGFKDQFRGHYAMSPMISYAGVDNSEYCLMRCVSFFLPCCCQMSTLFGAENKKNSKPWEVYQTRRAKRLEVTLDPLQWELKQPLCTEKTFSDLSVHCRRVCNSVSSPIKLVHGDYDGVISLKGTEKMAKECEYGKGKEIDDVFWKLVGERHVIMVGNYGKELFEDCVTWLKEKDTEGGKSVNPMV